MLSKTAGNHSIDWWAAATKKKGSRVHFEYKHMGFILIPACLNENKKSVANTMPDEIVLGEPPALCEFSWHVTQ